MKKFLVLLLLIRALDANCQHDQFKAQAGKDTIPTSIQDIIAIDGYDYDGLLIYDTSVASPLIITGPLTLKITDSGFRTVLIVSANEELQVFDSLQAIKLLVKNVLSQYKEDGLKLDYEIAAEKLLSRLMDLMLLMQKLKLYPFTPESNKITDDIIKLMDIYKQTGKKRYGY